MLIGGTWVIVLTEFDGTLASVDWWTLVVVLSDWALVVVVTEMTLVVVLTDGT